MGLKIEKMLEVPLTFFPIFSGIFSIEFLTFNVLFLGLGVPNLFLFSASLC